MNALTLRLHAHPALRLIPGLLLSAALAALATRLGELPAAAGLGLGGLTLAIVFGMVVGNTLYPPLAPVCQPGVDLAKQKLLRLGIILYGFRLTFQQIADVGVAGVVIDVLTLSSTFFAACWLGKHLFGLDRQTRWLIGAGSSICGAAAVLATEPVVKADAAKVAVAVATVVIFGTLAIFLYPLLWPLAQQLFPAVTQTQFGVYTGSTVHEVAQVVAAGHAVGPAAENAAVIAKMLRVMMLAPFLLFLGALLRRQPQQAGSPASSITFPWFALLFVLVALFNSLHLLPAAWIARINALDTLLLAMAMAALGLTTHVSALKRAGTRPLLLALLLFIWLIMGGGAINLLVHHFLP
ncbi:YeiH family putative sulfate export transporter [Pantoea sp. 1.19]|uniref:YeiH family putative sulfate export transporter n=1 Tax=Pantoea sp. 1.19 TaxID=1925589 RepID=UPI000948ECEE|nr:YeiH family putative sulfate export transporter [Pantoea sp. 1.19]